jgi:DNA polymerase-2
VFEQQEAVCFFPERQLGLLESTLGFSSSSQPPPVPAISSTADASASQSNKGERLSQRSAEAWRVAETKLKNFSHEQVLALYVRTTNAMGEIRRKLIAAGVELSEADVRAPDRFLMERFITGSLAFESEAGPSAAEKSTHTQSSLSAPFCNPRIKSAEFRPTLSALSFDIETDRKAEQLYSIAAYSTHSSKVFMLGDAQWREKLTARADVNAPLLIEVLPNERAVISAFLDHVAEVDPDVLIGWNVVNFDLRCLQSICDRLKMKLTLGRCVGGEPQAVLWREARERGSAKKTERYYATIPGRCALDGIELMRSATYAFENFSLETVAREVLGRGKLIEDVEQRGAEISTLFTEDKEALALYNLEDCKLVWDIFLEEKLIEFAIEKSLLTGLALDRYGGSVAALDFLYLPRLHRRGFVAPALGSGDTTNVSPGGYVLDSEPGIFDNVVVLDFKSLYPSIIRTFHVDPLALALATDEPRPIEGFDGGKFAREGAILPELIATLWAARDRAKLAGDSIMSQAIKIIMNSFYGVLGTSGCRFLDTRLVSSITKRGHQIILDSKRFIEEQGFRVIYGDTDSVFVLIPEKAIDVESGESSAPAVRAQAVERISERLATRMTDWWRDRIMMEQGVDSYLEMEFETHFTKFLMPTIRGTDAGSKKRYAGMVRIPDSASDSSRTDLLSENAALVDGIEKSERYRLVFKGLESVRTDWSPLAREFQRELYRRIFLGEAYAEYLYRLVDDLRAGRLDDKLVFRKRLRRRLDEYVKNVPPHIQAARKAQRARSEQGFVANEAESGWIEYIMTRSGAEPIRFTTQKPDYEFYIERQIEPIADAILGFVGDSMEKLFGRQIGLF